jgi:hypothetical protein
MQFPTLISAAIASISATTEIQLNAISSSQAISEAKALIEETGNSCPAVTALWSVEGSSQGAAFFKVSCSNNVDYQITIMGSRKFVKPWTGNLFEN